MHYDLCIENGIFFNSEQTAWAVCNTAWFVLRCRLPLLPTIPAHWYALCHNNNGNWRFFLCSLRFRKRPSDFFSMKAGQLDVRIDSNHRRVSKSGRFRASLEVCQEYAKFELNQECSLDVRKPLERLPVCPIGAKNGFGGPITSDGNVCTAYP